MICFKACLSSLVIVFTVLSCKFAPKEAKDSSEIKFLNENSRRRLATADETSNIYRLKTYGGNTCTAFAVQNAEKKPIIFTARHCMNYTSNDWCKSVGEILSADGSTKFSCKEIIFDPQDSDFAAMLVDKPLQSEGLLLADFDPAPGRRLQLIGFPSDWYAKSLGGAIITENCWLSQSPRQPVNVAVPMKPTPLALSHNCATYGGNSGGPMLIESTNVVVGLPASYWKSATIRSMQETAYIYPTKDMLAQHKDFITSQQIRVANVDPNTPSKQEFISRSRCKSTTMKTNIEELVPIYSSEEDFTALKVKFQGFDWILFRCRDDNLCNERTNNSGETIKIKSHSEITYTKNGVSAEFSCEKF